MRSIFPVVPSSPRGALFASLILLVIALPMLLMFKGVWQNSVMLPYLDDWHFVVDLGRLRDGKLELLAYLWQQHNEHRPVMWKAVSLASAAISPFYYYKIATYISFLVTLAALVFAILTTKALSVRNWVLAAGISLLFFSPIFGETWIWVAAASQFKFLLLGLALFAWATTRWPGSWPGTVGAALACMICTASAGSGLAIWGAAVLCLLVYQHAGVGRRIVSQIIFLSAWGILVWWGYFSTYHVPVDVERTDPLVFIVSQPMYFAQVVLALLGKPLVPGSGTGLAALAGLFGLLLLIAATTRLGVRNSRRLVAMIPLLLLAGFAVLNATVVVWFRSHLDLQELTVSGRYFISSIYFWVATFTALAVLVEEIAVTHGKYGKVARWTFSCSVLLVCGSAYLLAMQGQTEFMTDMKRRDATLLVNIREYERAPESEIPEFDWWVSKYFLRELERQRLSIFAVPTAREEEAMIRAEIMPEHGSVGDEPNAEPAKRARGLSSSPYQEAIQELIQRKRQDEEGKND